MFAFAIIIVLIASSCVNSCLGSGTGTETVATDSSEESEFDTFVRESQSKHFQLFVSLLSNGTRHQDVNITVTETAAALVSEIIVNMTNAMTEKMGPTFKKMVNDTFGQFRDADSCKVHLWACDNILSFKGIRMSEFVLHARDVQKKDAFFKHLEAFLDKYAEENPVLASFGAISFVKTFGKTVQDAIEYTNEIVEAK
tara:strand:+ start:416 stop:1009 length:594 start_codon:yes stop_codon:yes gene_type:complete